MHKKQVTFIVSITIAVLISLLVVVYTSINYVNRHVELTCFDRLSNTSKQLARELKISADTDRTILLAIASDIANSGSSSDQELCSAMNSYSFKNDRISQVRILKPDNTILNSDGTVHATDDGIDFKTEAKAGEHILSIINPDSPDTEIINAVPVIKNGKTIYILYGIIPLRDFAQTLEVNIYYDNAYLFIADSLTGNLLLDTWHESHGNLSEFYDLETLPGYSFESMVKNMEIGMGGKLGFISDAVDNPVFLSYEPIGIESWNIMVMVDRKTALEDSQIISNRLFLMAGLAGVIMLFYMICIMICLLKAYRQVTQLATKDPTTGLLNRNAYDKLLEKSQNRYFTSIACVFIDVNGLHEINNRFGHNVGDQMLCVVANALRNEFSEKRLFRIGGDEFVMLSDNESLESCTEKMLQVKQQIESRDYHIAYGISVRFNELAPDRTIQEADERMLEDKNEFYKTHDRRQR